MLIFYETFCNFAEFLLDQHAKLTRLVRNRENKICANMDWVTATLFWTWRIIFTWRFSCNL